MASFIARYSEDIGTFRSKILYFKSSIRKYISTEFGDFEDYKGNGVFKYISKNGDNVTFRSLGDITKERIYKVHVSGSKEEEVSKGLKKIFGEHSFLIE